MRRVAPMAAKGRKKPASPGGKSGGAGETDTERDDPEADGSGDDDFGDGDALEAQAEVIDEGAVPEDGDEPDAEPKGLARYDALQAYMLEIRKHPLLSPEEEHRLAVEYTESQDVDIAARLVTANLRLVVKLAYEYRR